MSERQEEEMKEGFGSVEELASRCFEDFARSNDGQMKEVIRDLKERSEEIPERANMAATRAVSSPAELEENFKQQFQEVVNRIEDTERDQGEDPGAQVQDRRELDEYGEGHQVDPRVFDGEGDAGVRG